MKKSIYRNLLILGILCINQTLGLCADVNVRSFVDNNTTYQDQEINFSIEIQNVKGNVPAPKLPAFQGFDTFYSGRASHFAFINGRSESRISFNYVLVAKQTGQFTLSPVEVAIEGKVYRTEPIQVSVLNQQRAASPSAPLSVPPAALPPPGAAQTPPTLGSQSQLPSSAPQPPSISNAEDLNIFLRVQPSKTVLYPNEQLLLSYTLLTRYDTSYEGFQEEAETSGFWVEEFPMERDLAKKTESYNGRKYMSADIKKIALFATAPGEYVIKPGTVKSTVQIEQRPSNLLDEFFNDSFFTSSGVFSRRVEKRLTAPPISVVVKPFPEQGKPAGFKGAVGELRMTSTLDKFTVNQNDPITMRITIEGEGNIETLGRPDIPELADVKMYDSDTKTEFFKAESLIAGKKVFEVIFIPKTAGNLTIPALEFSYFNPRSEKYVTLKTEAFQVRVNPSLTPPPALPRELADQVAENKQALKLEGRDIRYIHEKIFPSPSLFRGLPLGVLFADIFLTLTLIAMKVIRMRANLAGRDLTSSREKTAKRNAEKALKRLKTLSGKADEKSRAQFFDGCERLMNQYLADKLKLSPQGITLTQIEVRLLERQADADVIRKIHKFYDDCGAVRYAPPGGFSRESHEFLKTIEEIVKDKI